MRNLKAERLDRGETFITSEKGSSMLPLIKSGQKHLLTPYTWQKAQIGDIVYCKVHGFFYTHLVKQIDGKMGCLIGNNQGKLNGWTKQIYGKVTEAYPMEA